MGTQILPSNTITQILASILICSSFTTGHFHVYFAENVAYRIFPFNSWLGFQ